MENQHRKIKGYRELSPTEIGLMNEIKELGLNAESLFLKIDAHLSTQVRNARILPGNGEEVERLAKAAPNIWLMKAKHELQTALMKATRSVAQPTFF